MIEVRQTQSGGGGSKPSTPGKVVSAPTTKANTNDDESYMTLPDQLNQPSAAAVMLSPIVRKTRLGQETEGLDKTSE